MAAPIRVIAPGPMTKRVIGFLISAIFLPVGGYLEGQAVVATLELPVVLGFPGGEVVLPVELESTHAVTGISGGVSHDETTLSLISVEPGSAFASEAGVFLLQLSPTGGPGFTWGAVVDSDLAPPFATLAGGGRHEIARARYAVLATAAEGVSPIGFTSGLGAPPVELLVAVEAAGALAEVPVSSIPGGVDVTYSTFLRGDATDDGSINLLDVLRTLELIFLPLGGVECFDVLDVNDNGSLGVADALYLLEYLFLQTVPPPAVPFATCGIDQSDDALPCDGTRSACP